MNNLLYITILLLISVCFKFLSKKCEHNLNSNTNICKIEFKKTERIYSYFLRVKNSKKIVDIFINGLLQSETEYKFVNDGINFKDSIYKGDEVIIKYKEGEKKTLYIQK